MTLSFSQRLSKRIFDLVFSSLGLVAFCWIILLAFLVSSINTRANGFFCQKRIGRYGRVFTVIKIRTMTSNVNGSNVTTFDDPRITFTGRFMRKFKIDELPQLINIVKGDMSFVGPRPDVPGFADQLTGSDRRILSLRPGITGPATLKYQNEELILNSQSNPEQYNRDVLWPDKVSINLHYLDHWSLISDIVIIIKTLYKT